MSKFTGTGVALVTPFDDEYRIDEASLRDLVDYVIAGGVDFLVPLGTTSEAATLSKQERERVMQVVTEQNAGRVPMVVGVGGNNTEEVVGLLETLPFLDGCDAVLSVTPYYNKPTQAGMYCHFKRIAEKSPLPVILYNVPGRTGVNMTAVTTARLSNECLNIAGIKEASGNFEQAAEILKTKREDFTVLSGDDGITLPLMSMGFDGVISVIANAFPKEFSAMVKLIQAGNYKEAAAVHLQLLDIYKALFEEGNPAGVKAFLYAKGVIRHNKLRLPLVEASDGLVQRIRQLAK